MLELKNEVGFAISLRSISYKVKFVSQEITKLLNDAAKELEAQNHHDNAINVLNYRDKFNGENIMAAQRIHELGESHGLHYDEVKLLMSSQGKKYQGLIDKFTEEWISNKKKYYAKDCKGYYATLGYLITQNREINFEAIFNHAEEARPENLETLVTKATASYFCKVLPEVKKRWTGSKVVDYHIDSIEILKKQAEAFAEDGIMWDKKELYKRFAKEALPVEINFIEDLITRSFKPSPEVAKVLENGVAAAQKLFERNSVIERFFELYEEVK